ncbi:MAG TPA: hypothetical protein VHM25_11660 [Polyangiaceae bacterium]|jgi:hypothetical protein|nr:hypothetical protein [Polyangiaceae bacterium]
MTTLPNRLIRPPRVDLSERVEGRLARNDLRNVVTSVAGAGVILAAFLTPFLRKSRSHWGVELAEAGAPHPGDSLVPEPLWAWTHGIEVRERAEYVWPWVAQIGADRAGFYSYQGLENLVGCGLRNANAIHPDWELELGDHLLLHPQAPPLVISNYEREHYFVAHAPLDEAARGAGKPWATMTWLLQLEPLDSSRCRLISRFRVAHSSEIATRLWLGPTLLEPIGFAMDRRMLRGIKARAEW